MIKNVKYLLMLVLGIFIWNACGDDRAETTNVDLQFDFRLNGETLELEKTYQLNGTTVQFDIARFYVGGIELQPTTGNAAIFDDRYILVKAEENNYEVGDVDFADYEKLKFYVGVAPELNSQSEDDFTTRVANDPLAVQDPSMHWNWNSGYKFIRIDGQTDTDGDGVVDTPLAFHIGSDNFLRNLEYDLSTFQMGSNTINFTLDMNQLYEGIDLAVDWDTHTGNNIPLAQLFTANFEQALTIN